jgi:hypothetical protein
MVETCLTINASVPDGNSTRDSVGQLDLCTVEGVPAETGGQSVPGMAADHALPNNTCRTAEDR